MEHSKDYKRVNDDYKDTQDIILPLKDCEAVPDAVWIDPAIKKYCPNFTNDHFIYGDYYSTPASWSDWPCIFATQRKEQLKVNHVRVKMKLKSISAAL